MATSIATTPNQVTLPQIAERLRRALRTAEEMAAGRQPQERYAYQFGALQGILEAIIIELEN